MFAHTVIQVAPKGIQSVLSVIRVDAGKGTAECFVGLVKTASQNPVVTLVDNQSTALQVNVHQSQPSRRQCQSESLFIFFQAVGTLFLLQPLCHQQAQQYRRNRINQYYGKGDGRQYGTCLITGQGQHQCQHEDMRHNAKTVQLCPAQGGH